MDYEKFDVGTKYDLAAKVLFSNLLVKLKAALGPTSQVGVCLASYDRNPFIFVENSTEVIDAVDYFNVMSYEWAADGKFTNAKTAVAKIAAAGFPKKKINLGLAFYGKGGADYCSLSDACPDEPASSNLCGKTLIDGEDMQTAMGKWVVEEGYGGVLIFQANYDKNNKLLNALGKGLLLGER